MKRTITVLLAVCMIINIAAPSAYAAESGTTGRGIFGFSGEGKTEEQVEESTREETQVHESEPAQDITADRTSTEESAVEAAPAETNTADSAAEDVNAEQSVSVEDDADENISTDADAGQQNLIDQTITAAVLSNPTLSGRLKVFAKNRKSRFNSKSAEITITGQMPEGAVVEAYPVSVTVPGQNVLTAYDITIYDADGEVWQPDDSVTVSITDAALESSSDGLSIYHMEDGDAELELVMVTESEGTTVQFEADSFSIYIVGEGVPETTYIFQVEGEENPFRTISLKEGEVLKQPQDPYRPDKGVFSYWTLNGDKFDDFGKTASVIGNTTTTLYAKFDGNTTVSFLSLPVEDGDEMERRVYRSKTGVAADDSVNMDITYSAPSGYQHVGWTDTEPTAGNGYGLDVEDYFELNQSVPLDQIKTNENHEYVLYPVLREGYWLTFYANGGSIYTSQENLDTRNAPLSTRRYHALQTENAPLTMQDVVDNVHPDTWVQRSGYTLEGWYTDAALTNKFDFVSNSGTPITADSTFYAKWKESTSSYTVVYWKENVEAGSFSLLGTEKVDNISTGTTISLGANSGNAQWKAASDKLSSNPWNDADLPYFYLAEITSGNATSDASKDRAVYTDNFRVAGDGSTILNVWFNRKVFKLEFKNGSKITSTAYVRLGEPMRNRKDVNGNPLPDLYPDGIYTFYAAGSGSNNTTDVFWPYSNANRTILGYGNGGSGTVPAGETYAGETYYKTITGTKKSSTYANRTIYEHFQTVNEKGETSIPSQGTATTYQASANGQLSRLYEGYVIDFDQSTEKSRIGNNNSNAAIIKYYPDLSAVIHKDFDKKTDESKQLRGELYIDTTNTNYKPHFVYTLRSFKLTLQSYDIDHSKSAEVLYTRRLGDVFSNNDNDMGSYLKAPDRTGLPSYMKFKGWYTDQDFAEDEYFADENGVLQGKWADYKMPAANFTLYARFEADPITVTIDKNTGVGGEQTNQAVNSDAAGKADKLKYTTDPYSTDDTLRAGKYTISAFMPQGWSIPEWENHIFLGWQQIDPDTGKVLSKNFDMDSRVDTDICLRASWQDMSPNHVTYEVGNSTGETSTTAIVDKKNYLSGATAVVLGGPESDEYADRIFLYWTDPDNRIYYPGDTIVVPAGGITLTAQFEDLETTSRDVNEYTFYVSDTNNYSNLKTVTPYYVEKLSVGEKLIMPKTPPAPEGKYFLGWFKNPGLTEPYTEFDVPENPKDTNIYAKFGAKYFVYYHSMPYKKDGTQMEDRIVYSQAYENGQTLDTTGVVCNLENRYILTGWTTDQNSRPDETPSTVYSLDKVQEGVIIRGADIHLYPVTSERYTITFVANGGSVVEPVSLLSTDITVAPETSRTGYTLEGWYTEEAFTNKFTFGGTIDKNYTLYAKWDEANTNYKVVFWKEAPQQKELWEQIDAATDQEQLQALNAQRKYEYAAEITLHDTAGVDINESMNKAENTAAFYDTLNAIDEVQYFEWSGQFVTNGADTRIAADGSTILSYYLNRKVYTLNFDMDTYDMGQSFSDSNGTAFMNLYEPSASHALIYGNGNNGANGYYYPYRSNGGSYYVSGFNTSKNSKSLNNRNYPGPVLEMNGSAYRMRAFVPGNKNFTSGAFQQMDNYRHVYTARVRLGDMATGVWPTNVTSYKTSEKWDFFAWALMYNNMFLAYTEPVSEINNAILQYADSNNTINYNANYTTSSTSRNITLKYYIQNLDNDNYTLDESLVIKAKNTSGTFSSLRDYYGYKLRDNRTVDLSSGSTFEYHFDRIRSDIHIYNGSSDSTLIDSYSSVKYGTDLKSLPGWIAGNSSIPPYPDYLGDYFEFEGWYTQPDFVASAKLDLSQPLIMPPHELNLYAHWVPKMISVTVDLNDGVNDARTDHELIAGKTAFSELVHQFGWSENPEREGYAFSHWEDSSGQEISAQNILTKSDTVTARWIDTRTYTLVYQIGDNADTETDIVDTNKYMAGAKVRVINYPSDAENADIFACWADAEGNLYYPGEMFEIPQTDGDPTVRLYAKFFGERETSLIYDFNGGSIEMEGESRSTLEVVFADYLKDAAHIPNTVHTVGTDNNGAEFTPVRVGYKLKGWSINPEESPDSEYLIRSGQDIRVDTLSQGGNTLYAIWEKSDIPLTITVTTDDISLNYTYMYTVYAGDTENPTEQYGEQVEAVANGDGVQIYIPIGQYVRVVQSLNGNPKTAKTTFITPDGTESEGSEAMFWVADNATELSVSFQNCYIIPAPTGVSIKVLPYLYILIAGIAGISGTVFFSRRRREAK